MKDTALASFVPDERYIDTLLSELSSVDLATRSLALREVERLVSQPQTLMRVVEREAARYQQCTLRGTLISLAAVSGAGIAAYLYPDADAWFAVGAIALLMAGWLSVYIPRRARRSLIGVLENMRDPRFIGPALTMLVPDGVTEVKAAITHNRMVRDSITRALKVMLPQARANHRDALTRSQMQTLVVLMKQSRKDPALTICILRALQQIGGTSETSAVQAFTRSRHPGVSEAAQETLEYLELRGRERQQAQTLLRASDARTNAAPNVLLRPATQLAETPSEQLLRPQA